MDRVFFKNTAEERGELRFVGRTLNAYKDGVWREGKMVGRGCKNRRKKLQAERKRQSQLYV